MAGEGEEAPHLKDDHAAFDQALRTLVELEHNQEAATARLREATRVRNEQDNRVRLINNRLVAGLQAHFGPENERLIAFHVPPRKRRSRRKPEQPPAPEPTQSAPKPA